MTFMSVGPSAGVAGSSPRRSRVTNSLEISRELLERESYERGAKKPENTL